MNKKQIMKKALILSIIAAATLTFSACASQQKTCQKKNIGLQLYSLRTDIKKDYAGTVKAAGEMGFTECEAAGYADGKFYGLTPEEFKKSIEANGMKVISSHARKPLSKEEIASGDYSKSLEWWKKAIDAHKRAGMKYVVDPYEKFSTMEELKAYANYFNQIGKLCKDAGLRFGYHNHKHEYQKIGKQMILDYLIENTNPEYVNFEMDVYWTVRGEQSPVAYFKKYPNRFMLLHIKDDKELGQSGMVGFDAIFNNLPKSVEGIVVEVERYNFEPKVSVKKSIDYLQNSDFVPASYPKK